MKREKETRQRASRRPRESDGPPTFTDWKRPWDDGESKRGGRAIDEYDGIHMMIGRVVGPTSVVRCETTVLRPTDNQEL